MEGIEHSHDEGGKGGRRLSRRSLLGGGAALALGGALGAAPGGAGALTPPGRTNGPGRNGGAAGRPRRGGALVFGADAEEQGFDPTTAEWDEVGYMYGRTVFDPLFAVTNTGRVVPYLAQTISHSPEYTSWTITLRPGISFHDGTPCDGAALLFNLEKQSTSILTGAVFSQFISDISQVGPLSVRVDTKAPWVTFPFYASSSSQVGYLAAPSMLKSADGTSHPVGTGPFVFESWQPNDHFSATRNTKYWRRGYPFLDSITFKPIIDDSARSAALQSGTVDIMITYSPPSILEYRGNRQWSYVDDSGAVVGEPQVSFIQLNCSEPPFDDHGARLAMAKSYSQEDFFRVVEQSVGGPVDGPFVKGTALYTPTSYPGYDPAGARRLVRSYEHRTGRRFAFTLDYIPDPQVARGAAYLQERYQQAGMKCSLSVVEQNALISDAVAGKYQATTWRQFGAVDPDLNYVFWSTGTVHKSGISLNIARNVDERIQTALTTGRQSADAAVRTKAYRSIAEYFAQDLPYLWLGRIVWAAVANPAVENFNHPVAPDGSDLIGMANGVLWPTQIWKR